MREEDFQPRRGDDVYASSGRNAIRGRTETSALEERDSNHHHEEKLIEATAGAARTARAEREIPDATHDAAEDDQSIRDPAEYATCEDELKAIVRAKTGQDMPWKELIWIKDRLELQTVSIDDFVIAVRKHARNEWRNPIGFLKFFARNFGRNTRPATPPLPKIAADAPSKCSCTWGYLSQAPPTFCTNCQLGRELGRDFARQAKHEEKRRAAIASEGVR
jgi:hypothetical protein